MKRKTIIRIAVGFGVGFSLLTAWHYVSDCYLFGREQMPMRYYMLKSAVPVSFTFATVLITGHVKARRERKRSDE